MKRAAIIIAGAGVALLLLALFIGYTQTQACERTKEAAIVSHALFEWKLARQHLERMEVELP